MEGVVVTCPLLEEAAVRSIFSTWYSLLLKTTYIRFWHALLPLHCICFVVCRVLEAKLTAELEPITDSHVQNDEVSNSIVAGYMD